MRNVSVLRWIALGVLLVPWASLSGCQSRASDEELGTIVYEVPKVPGSEKPFPLPDLDPNAKSDMPIDPFGDPSLMQDKAPKK